jgi:hypothetical protein
MFSLRAQQVVCGRNESWTIRMPEGALLRTIEVGRVRGERHQRAVGEIQERLAKLYRGFVAWASLYGDVEDREERERRERVVELLDDLHNGYLPRSVWLTEANRKKIEGFLHKTEDLYSEFCAAIEERGYENFRAGMAKRVSKRLGPLKKAVESSLEAELSGEQRAGWRGRLRKS